VRTERQLDRLAKAVLLSSVVPIAIGIGQIASGNTYERVGTSLKSVRGPFPHPNYFAFYLVVVLGVAVLSLMESRQLYERLALVALTAAGTVTLFLTYTRSAWIGFMVTILVMGLLRYRKLLVIAVVGIALAAFAAPDAAREAQQRFGDLTSKSEASAQNSWTWRVNQWSAMIPYGFDRPLTGQGWDSYTRLTVRRYGHFNKRYPTVLYPAYGVYSAVGFSAHNDYVKDFVELGVPGLALLILTLTGLGSTAWRARRVGGAAGLAATMVGCAVALMVISAVDNLQGYTVALTYAFALCGALAGVTAGTRRMEPAASVDAELAPRKAPPPVAPPLAQPADEVQPDPEPVRAPGWRARLRGMLGRGRPRS
jgi:O-antigen ligase